MARRNRTARKAPQQQSAAPAQDTSSGNVLAKKAVLAGLGISRWTARRFDQKITAEVHKTHGAKDAGRFNKQLIAKKAMADISRLCTEARRYHYTHTQPWFDGGARILPSTLYTQYAAEMQRLRQEYDAAADAFESVYPQLVQDAQRDLNGMFDPNDYPHANNIRGKFKLEVTIQPCPDTSDFRIALANEHVDDVRKDLEARMNEALAASQRDVVERIMQEVGHMVERLRAYTPAEEEGDRTVGAFRDSLVQNVRDLVDLLPAFNWTDDRRMTEITSRMREQLCKKEAHELREDEAARAEVAGNAEAILNDVKDFLA